MAIRYFVDTLGNYIGGFDGATPPLGSIEVLTPPISAFQKWDGTKWLSLSIIPQEVIAYQAKEALILSGIMPTQIETIINGLASPTKELAMNQWLNAPTFKRYNSWISQLAPLIPLTEVQLDNLFVLAETL